MRKPWYWEAREGWYVRVGKTQVFLHADEDKAYDIWREKVAADKPEDPKAPTCAIAEAFLEWAVKNVSSKTYRGYSDFIASFCKKFGHIPARTLKPFHITRWLTDYPQWGSETQRGAIAKVKRCFNWAQSEGLIDHNPLAAVRKPTAKRREGLISEDQHRAMVLNVDAGRLPGNRAATLGLKPRRRDIVFRAILIALKHSGARPSMIASVRVEDVAPDLSTWTMNQHKTRKKTGAPLVIYLSPCLQTLTRLAIGSRTSGPLFLNSLGKAWTANAITCRVKNLRKKLNLPAGTVAYAYRHTYITTAIKRGVGLATAAELAGHSDLKMIAKHYGHLDKETDHLKAAAALAIRRA